MNLYSSAQNELGRNRRRNGVRFSSKSSKSSRSSIGSVTIRSAVIDLLYMRRNLSSIRYPWESAWITNLHHFTVVRYRHRAVLAALLANALASWRNDLYTNFLVCIVSHTKATMLTHLKPVHITNFGHLPELVNSVYSERGCVRFLYKTRRFRLRNSEY